MREGALEGAAGWTIAIFGASTFVAGVLGLLHPEALLELLGCEAVHADDRSDGDYTLTFITASSMAAINMGAYYALAAAGHCRAFYRWTVPFRCVAASVFTSAVLIGRAPVGFLAVAAWELLGAIATGMALRWDQQRASGPT